MLVGITCTLKSETVHGTAISGLASDTEEEFDSPATVEALAAVFRGLGHTVEVLGDGEPLLRRLLNGPKPDFVFNFAEGRGAGRSREARVPAVLEMLGIPYSGSDPLTLAVTLDKDCAKRLVRAAGLPTPNWVLVDGPPEQFASHLLALQLPVIVKPAFEGSSKGIATKSLIQNRADLLPAVRQVWELYHQSVLIEEFIDGTELTVGMVGNPPDVLGILAVVPKPSQIGPFVYSLEVKRDWEDRVEYQCPAQISEADTHAVREAARGAWRALGCRDVSRIDYRLREGVPYFLEVNPLPGLAPVTSDLVIIANLQGIEHAELVRRIFSAAETRIFGGGATC